MSPSISAAPAAHCLEAVKTGCNTWRTKNGKLAAIEYNFESGICIYTQYLIILAYVLVHICISDLLESCDNSYTGLAAARPEYVCLFLKWNEEWEAWRSMGTVGRCCSLSGDCCCVCARERGWTVCACVHMYRERLIARCHCMFTKAAK